MTRKRTPCMTALAAFAMVLSPGCERAQIYDFDGDGYPDAEDCDSEDPDINPSADEICDDGIDNDCDGAVDDADPACSDPDGDGYTDEADCTEGDPTIYDGADEDCLDDIDHDCDGLAGAEDPDCDYAPILGACPNRDVRFEAIEYPYFSMGNYSGQVGADDDEIYHGVSLTHDLCLGRTEITQQQFEEALGYNPSDVTPDHGIGVDHPVFHVSWYDALAYTVALSGEQGLEECYELTGITCQDGTAAAAAPECMTGEHGGIGEALVAVAAGLGSIYDCDGYRLPTEAEWEGAAKWGPMSGSLPTPNAGYLSAGDEQDCTGNLQVVIDELDDSAWYCGNAQGTTHPVAVLDPSQASLHDLAGNVWEWCFDGYVFDLSVEVPEQDPVVLEGDTRVIRGGSWDDYPEEMRYGNRESWPPGEPDEHIGFRLARTFTDGRDEELP